LICKTELNKNRVKNKQLLYICTLIFALQLLSGCDTSTSKASAGISTLGKQLFFDSRLSFNNTKSCGSCHDPKFAFSDGYRRSITAEGNNVKHNAPSLINSSFYTYFDWDNPGVTALEKQHERPLFGQHPVEMGAGGNEAEILLRIKSDSFYKKVFLQTFPNDKYPFRFDNIISAIAAYVKTLNSSNSLYDSFMKGDTSILSISAKEGMRLFFSDQLKCGRCHVPPLFTTTNLTTDTDSVYINIGLYNVMDRNKYPENDRGLASFTKKESDDGKFKIPSLRNVTLTSPYMHDGSMNNLEEIIDMYARGGRNIINGPMAGDGKNNGNKDKRITGFTISAKEKKQLIDFLYSLTDSSVLTNPHFQNPFNQPNK
jgi:cytochrome c peroxidase